MSNTYELKMRSSFLAKKIRNVDGWSINNESRTLVFIKDDKVVLLVPIDNISYVRTV